MENPIGGQTGAPQIESLRERQAGNDIVGRTHLSLPELADLVPPQTNSAVVVTSHAAPANVMPLDEQLARTASVLPSSDVTDAIGVAGPDSVYIHEYQSKDFSDIAATPTVALNSPEVEQAPSTSIPEIEQLPFASVPEIEQLSFAGVPEIEQASFASTSGTERSLNTSSKRTRRFYLLLYVALFILAFIILMGILIYTHQPAAPHPPQSSNHVAPAGSTIVSQSAMVGGKIFQVGALPSIIIHGQGAHVTIVSGHDGSVLVQTDSNGSLQGTAGTQYVQSHSAAGADLITVTTAVAYSNYHVTVPTSSQVQIKLLEGTISVDGVRGVIITNESGDRNVAHVHGSINVVTSSGNVAVRNVQGAATMKTTNGSIKATNIRGPVDAQAQSGDVTIQQATLSGNSTLQTTYGSVNFTGTLDVQGTDTLKTQSGNVNLTLPANTFFQLQATTSNGTVTNAFKTSRVVGKRYARLIINIGTGSAFIQKMR
jgi:hypothetical protein